MTDENPKPLFIYDPLQWTLPGPELDQYLWKMTASENRLFLEAVVFRRPPPLIAGINHGGWIL